MSLPKKLQQLTIDSIADICQALNYRHLAAEEVLEQAYQRSLMVKRAGERHVSGQRHADTSIRDDPLERFASGTNGHSSQQDATGFSSLRAPYGTELEAEILIQPSNMNGPGNPLNFDSTADGSSTIAGDGIRGAGDVDVELTMASDLTQSIRPGSAGAGAVYSPFLFDWSEINPSLVEQDLAQVL